ncbi:hypothetical protein KR222_008189, partial [Zaprionus bogoriensis]
MYSIWRKLFGSAEDELEVKRDLLKLENRLLDQAVLEEQVDSHGNNNKQDEDETENEEEEEDAIVQSACVARRGVISSLSKTGGIIDNTISFDCQAAQQISEELQPGCVVEYLSYTSEQRGSRVVKILSIIESNWNATAADQKIEDALQSLKLDKPRFFNTQVRNILGAISQRLPASIVVDTDYGDLSIELDNVEISFIPHKGDNVCLLCNVQLDEGYVDKQGEILEVKKVTPARIELQQKCTVDRVLEEFVVLDTNAYALQEDVPKGISLHLGDIVMADLIECDYSKYSRRAVKLSLLEKNFGRVNSNNLCGTGKQMVTILGVERFVFTEQWKKQNVTLKLQNNGHRQLTLNSIEIQSPAEAQISVVEPVSSRQIDTNGVISVVFEVHTKFVGESKERYALIFDTFKIRRYLTIIVCETDEAAREAERRLIASEQLSVKARTVGQRSRFYAHQVWSIKNTLVPGESVATQRRFVKARLGPFNVPEKMREIKLTTERRFEMQDSLEALYPCVKEPLSSRNYAQRFSTLLHLEEIDYTVNFRNYDRERAHFQRDGEFLSLQIENLAERRPSLVLGDTVHALNPWLNCGSKENKSFEGIVHKVLFNRVLLKFNSSFQDKYNGEDYRLTFHFSRFTFRKQHYAAGRILSHLGEHFLFPNKVLKRQNPQLEVTFRDDNIYLLDDKLPWYNPGLNSIQKRAVYNILRGETDKMPYVIFGPPGTGKTLTLVEAVLQLVRNLPGARLLIGTPSNSSADLIIKRIIDSNVLAQGDFIRLVSQNQVERDLIPPELKSYCATGDIGVIDDSQHSMIVTDSGLKLRCQMKFLVLHRIIIGTCTTLGNFLQMDIPPGHFTHVLIDEAGQCTEPETVVPCLLLSQTQGQVVLAGDPHQLQPIVLSTSSANYGLRKSLLERLLELAPYSKDMQRFPHHSGYNPAVLTKLLYNYRALPSIMAVYSKLFYDNELVPMLSEQESREARLLADLQVIFEPNVDMPRTQGTFFYGIMGENMQEPDSPSWYNPSEAREVFLITIQLYRRNVHPDQIGILTPYAKQVKVLRNMFIGADVSMPKIGSVEEFQGQVSIIVNIGIYLVVHSRTPSLQERDIMLISTVRSATTLLNSDALLNLGFVLSKKRMNVACSRARALMVIFGNPNLLCIDDCWRHLILYCANNNAYFGCELPKKI